MARTAAAGRAPAAGHGTAPEGGPPGAVPERWAAYQLGRYVRVSASRRIGSHRLGQDAEDGQQQEGDAGVP